MINLPSLVSNSAKLRQNRSSVLKIFFGCEEAALTSRIRILPAEVHKGRHFMFVKGVRATIHQYISDELFRSPEGTILDPDNLYHRVFLPVLAKAGIRKTRFHDLRHTFGSLLLQNGATIVYVKEQMGHSSIQVTVDTYGHRSLAPMCVS